MLTTFFMMGARICEDDLTRVGTAEQGQACKIFGGND